MKRNVAAFVALGLVVACDTTEVLHDDVPDASTPNNSDASTGMGPDDAAMLPEDGSLFDVDLGAEFAWDLPRGFPEPKVPDDNPMNVAKVELGRHLFYDKRLSENQEQSCGSCHKQELAFTDGRAQGLGSTGELHPRSPMSLTNVAYAPTLTWVNPVVTSLEAQALVPLFGAEPVELGFEGKKDELMRRVAAEPRYQELFPKAFPEASEPISLSNITKAIAAFERTLISGRSAYDRYIYGDPEAMSDAARRGMDLFFDERMECFHCHGGFNFSDSETHAGKAFDEIAFHNTGLYNLGGTGAYPSDNMGLFFFTEVDRDMGRFKAPTLRNVELTAPYMHDGSIATLGEVIDHYAAGGRTIDEGPNAGVGSLSPYKSGLVPGFEATEAEKADLIEFLKSLTDDEFLSDPRFADPWVD